MEDIAKYAPPAKAVEEGGIRGREHEGIPRGRVLIARTADRDGTALHLLRRIHDNVHRANLRTWDGRP